MSMLPEPPVWSPEEIAEFHLNNAMDEEEYRWAVGEVVSMELDPLKLDLRHLLQEEPWQNPALHPVLLGAFKSKSANRDRTTERIAYS